MTALVRVGGFFFHKPNSSCIHKITVASDQWPVASQILRWRLEAARGVLQKAGAGAGGAAVAVWLGSLAGQVDRKRELWGSLALA
jgi:hypothetical protein